MSSKKILDYYGKINFGFLHSHGEASTELLINKLNVQANDDVLEIGFGTGATLVKIASRFSTARYYGIERSSQMLEKAQKRINFCFLPKIIQLKQAGSVELLNVHERKMDKIYIESVLGIQEDDELKKMILKIQEQLQPNGLLVINETIWKDDVLKEEIEAINKNCKEAFGIIQSNGKYHTKKLWNDLFVECGFTVRSMEVISVEGLFPERKNWREFLSAVYSKIGKIKGSLNKDLRSEMEAYKKSMKNSVTGNRQIMTGVLFVLQKNR